MKPRVRFAPSPTGFLHIGGLRTALYNYLFAKHHGGDVILRIEDTDRTRYVPEALANILETLAWAGIQWDEGPMLKKKFWGGTKIIERGGKGPYTQSLRTDLYRKYADQLLAQGKAYRCFCTQEEIDAMREKQKELKQPPMYDGRCRHLSSEECKKRAKSGAPYVIRLRVPDDGETVFNDLIRGEVRFNHKDIDDQVLMKSDGFPTYHLANVVDDHLMEITHVIRGEEWLSSTPKHILLYEAFGWTPPEFAHTPQLLNADRSKLSKRTGDVAASDYRKKGYLPAALINFIALLGWNPRADQEIYTIDELIKEFDLSRVNKSGAVVNFEKLRWVNAEYLRKMEVDELVKFLKSWMPENVDSDLVRRVVSLVKERLEVGEDFPKLTGYFFVEAPEYDATLLSWKGALPEQTKARLKRAAEILSGVGEWTLESLERTMKEAIEKESLGTGDTLWPMRVALTGLEKSPSPFEVAVVLGKVKTLKRLELALQKI